MIFNFLVLINLALVSRIRSSSFSINSYLRQRLSDNCSFVEQSIKPFDDCQGAEGKLVIDYGRHAVPFMCLVFVDIAVELCKDPELFKKLQSRTSDIVCPMNYSLKPEESNLKLDVTPGLKYLKDEENCVGVCHYDEVFFRICEFIAIGNEIIKERKSAGESSDHVKGDDIQPIHLLEKGRTDNVTGGEGAINEDMKSAHETNRNVSLKPFNENQSMTNDKSDINKPVTKTEAVTLNKTTNAADLGLKPDLKSKGPDGSIHKNDSYKATNDSNSSNVRVNNTVLKGNTSINNENYKTKPIEINKSHDLASNKGNTDIPRTESPPPPPPQPPLENDYSSKNQQNNVNMVNNNNNNVNSNNNNMEFEDDPAMKTPHDEGEDDDDNNNEDMDKSPMQDTLLVREHEFGKSPNQKEIYSGDNFFQAEDSHFSTYFLTTISIVIVGYVIYHNKKKILAYALEGRRNKNGRRRPASASYRKLDCTLEEAIASNPSNTAVTNVVY